MKMNKFVLMSGGTFDIKESIHDIACDGFSNVQCKFRLYGYEKQIMHVVESLILADDRSDLSEMINHKCDMLEKYNNSVKTACFVGFVKK